MSGQQDQYYPSVDATFLDSLIRNSPKFLGTVVAGSSTAYILAGTSAIAKRTVILRPSSTNEIGYMAATGVAIKIGKLEDLTKWFEHHCKWKDGAYVV